MANSNMIYTPDQHIPVGVVVVSGEDLQLQIKNEKKTETVNYEWFQAEVQRVAQNIRKQG